jgi:Ca-activated chloride channel homolog
MGALQSAIVAGIGAALCLWPGQAQQLTFRAAAQTVPVYATVTDGAGRLVSGLTRDDFEIYDNGERQDVALFDNASQPISVVVMLDSSGSMTMHLDVLKQAAAQFLERLQPGDRARVGSFSARRKISLGPSEFTADKEALLDVLRDDLQVGNPTALWDATHAGIEALEGEDGRRVVLVFTDGTDTDSAHSQKDVLAGARDSELMIYAIGLRSSTRGEGAVRLDPGLRRVADETGGGYFELRRTDALGATFTRVAQELRSQYLLGFSPARLDGKVHTLDVRVRQPGLTARARRSYLAR